MARTSARDDHDQARLDALPERSDKQNAHAFRMAGELKRSLPARGKVSARSIRWHLSHRARFVKPSMPYVSILEKAL